MTAKQTNHDGILTQSIAALLKKWQTLRVNITCNIQPGFSKVVGECMAQSIDNNKLTTCENPISISPNLQIKNSSNFPNLLFLTFFSFWFNTFPFNYSDTSMKAMKKLLDQILPHTYLFKIILGVTNILDHRLYGCCHFNP